jgi:hypothetical protein
MIEIIKSNSGIDNLTHYLSIFSNCHERGIRQGSDSGLSIGGGLVFKYSNLYLGFDLRSLSNDVDDKIDLYVGYKLNLFDGIQFEYRKSEETISKNKTDEFSIKMDFQQNYSNKFIYNIDTKNYYNILSAKMSIITDLELKYGYTNEPSKPNYIELSAERGLGNFYVTSTIGKQLNQNKDDYQTFDISYAKV